MEKDYHYVDLDILSKKFAGWGMAKTSTHSGNTEDTNMHRIFLTRGQFNKLVGKLESRPK